MSLEDFMAYCEKNKDCDRKLRFFHDYEAYYNLLRSVVANHSIIGLRGVSKSYQHVGLMDGNQAIGCISIVFITREEVYLCDLSTTKFSGQGSETRLQEEYDYVKRFGFLPIRVSVRKASNGKLKVRKIMPDINDLIALTKS